jgi:hypothetical protein
LVDGESWLTVMFVVGALVITTLARENNVDTFVQVFFVAVFAAGMLVLWAVGRGPNAWPFLRDGKGERMGTPKAIADNAIKRARDSK